MAALLVSWALPDRNRYSDYWTKEDEDRKANVISATSEQESIQAPLWTWSLAASEVLQASYPSFKQIKWNSSKQKPFINLYKYALIFSN